MLLIVTAFSEFVPIRWKFTSSAYVTDTAFVF